MTITVDRYSHSVNCHTMKLTHQNPLSLFFYCCSVPPCITGPPQDQIVSLETDNTVTFSCIAEGFPQPAITWQHKGMDISGESIDVSLTASALFRVNSTMTLSGLSSSDSGSIMCMATVTATVTADTGDHVVILTDIAESTLSVFGTYIRAVYNILASK